MHYYQHDLTGYRLATAHLSLMEHGVYRLLIDHYYATEAPLPKDENTLRRIVRAAATPERKALKSILRQFFIFEDGAFHDRTIDKAITAWKTRGWRPSENPTPRMGFGEWQALKARIFLRDNFICAYCTKRGGELECDHIVPVSKGGSNLESNLTTSCRACNRSKSDKSLDEWRNKQ